MTISNRLIRAGLAFLVFGTCASLVPGTGITMQNAIACNPNVSGTGHRSSVTTTAVTTTAASVALLFLADPALFGVGGGGFLGSGAAGLGAFDPAAQQFQFIYDSSGPSA